ncbi:MAG: DUF2058 family protein [Pseudomonadota bacterium]|nr:DUF2058 family protein [Pseudomonadota bacterium]
MTDSLRNQLLGLGFKPAPAPERKPARRPERDGGAKPVDRQDRNRGNAPAGKPPRGSGPKSVHADQHGRKPRRDSGQGRSGAQGSRSREDIDLAKAYAIRAQREKDERVAAEQAKQEQARERREARARLATLVKDKVLNAADADIARHFPYGGKIKRIYVTVPQLKALNAGELGVLQMDGRYILVDAAVMAEAGNIFAPAIALRVDPDAPAEEDPYADPQYQVPDDLVW